MKKSQVLAGIIALITPVLGTLRFDRQESENLRKTPTADVTYAGEISKIFRTSCVPCHSPNGIAPFSLTSYAEIKRNAELVRIQVLLRSMPPPEPLSEVGTFRHTRALTHEEMISIQRWFQAGMQEGPPIKSAAPVQKPAPTKGKFVGKVTGEVVRTEGVRYWRSFLFQPNGQVKNLQSWDIFPKDGKAFRSVKVALVQDHSTGDLARETAGIPLFSNGISVGAWSPGYRKWTSGTGVSLPIPKNAKIIVQVLYQPLGKPADGSFEFVATDSKGPAVEMKPIVLEKSNFVIGAYTNPIYELEYVARENGKLHSIVPEARFYASKIELIASAVDGKESVLFDAFRWDPYWIGNYSFPTPVNVTKGTKLRARFYYENDETCPSNAGKTPEPVTWGPRIENEFCRMTLWLIPEKK